MAFEKYLGCHVGRGRNHPPCSRLTGNALALNVPLYTMLGCPDNVDLYYDADTRTLGILPNDEGRARVSHRSGQTPTISIKGFRRVFGITADKISVPFAFSDEHQIWVGRLPDEEAPHESL